MKVWLDKEDDPHPERTEELDGRNPDLFFKSEQTVLAQMEADLLMALNIITAIVHKEDCQLDNKSRCLIHTECANDGECAQKIAKDFLKDFGIKI